ncbi:MAG: TonB family protein [Acidobacteriia bacterium]|jgi:TonB family protein|nr:TonB family protein [Terriglobia bacterium]
MRCVSAVLGLFVLAGAGWAQAPPAQPLPAVPRYEDSVEGLEKFMRTVLEAAQKGDERLVYAHTRSLLLPNPREAFAELFGDALQEGYAERYAERRAALYLVLARDLTGIAKAGFAHIRVGRYEEGCSPLADEDQVPVLLARRRPVVLYDVRVLRKKEDKSAAGLRYFLYQDGGFRYLGNITLEQGAPVFGSFEEAAAGSTPGKRLRAGGEHAVKFRSKNPPPTYPQQARDANLQGRVRLLILFGTDGAVKAVRLLSGHCWLFPAALDAVRQWNIEPVQVNGEAVEVVVPLEVTFALSSS